MVIYLPLEGRPNPWTEWTYFPDTLIDNNIIYKPYNPNNDPYFIMHIILALKKRKVAGVYGPKR